MKEAIVAFVIALVLGAGVNQFIGAAPPPQEPDHTAAKTDEPAEAPDYRNVGTVSDESFDKDVLKSDKPVLVDFYSETCEPCKMMAPVIGKLANEYQGKISFYRCDVEANPATVARYRVESMPTFIIYNKGQRGDSYTGLVQKGLLAGALDKTIK